MLGDVRDVDLQLVVPVRQFANQHGVVKITRGFTINRNDRQIAVVAASTQIGGGNCLGNISCLLDHFGWKTMWQMVFANDDLDVDAEIIFVAQYLDNTAPWVLGSARPVGDFDIDHNTFQVFPIGVVSNFITDDPMLLFPALGSVRGG